MEKFIKSLSTLITCTLIYVIASYIYLSSKGFEYNNGVFTLVKSAQADTNKTNDFATAIDKNIALNFKTDKFIGDKNAPLTLFEFSSLGCSHCADFHLNILPKLEQDFISKGKLKVVFVNFPLEKKSMKAAMLADCLDNQERERFLNTVFLKQREWMLSFNVEDVLSKYVEDTGLSKEQINNCLNNDNMAQEILANRQDAIDKLKMQGTPAFLFSSQDKNEIIYGVPNYEKLKSYIESRL